MSILSDLNRFLHFLLAFYGLCLIGCQTVPEGFQKNSDAEGEIAAVLINITDPSLVSKTYRSKLLRMVGSLTDSMEVVVHSYVDLSPVFYGSHIFESKSDSVVTTTSNSLDRKLFDGYRDWLVSLNKDSVYDQLIDNLIQEARNAELSWSRFSQLYDCRLKLLPNEIIQKNEFNAFDSKLFEVIAVNTELVENSIDFIDSEYAYLQNRLSESQLKNLRLIRSHRREAYDILNRTCPDACDPCLSENHAGEFSSVCRMREIEWVQDRVMIGSSQRKKYSIVNCRSIYSLEAALVSDKLCKMGYVDKVEGIELCFDGANVFRANETIIARDELDFSVASCPENGMSTLDLGAKFDKLFRDSELKWLQLPSDSSPDRRFNDRLGTNNNNKPKGIGLPLHHLDLFLTFGVSESHQWTAFVGRINLKYYKDNYVVFGLTETDKKELNRMSQRLNDVADTLVSWGYDTVRVPLIPLHAYTSEGKDHPINGLLTYNNGLIECYKSKSGLIKNAYLSKYDFGGFWDAYRVGLETKTIQNDVEEIFQKRGYNIRWVEGFYWPSRMAGLRCYTKVLSRNKLE